MSCPREVEEERISPNLFAPLTQPSDGNFDNPVTRKTDRSLVLLLVI